MKTGALGTVLATVALAAHAVTVDVMPGEDAAVVRAAECLRRDLDRACPGHAADARRIVVCTRPDGRREASVRTYEEGVWTVTGSDRRGTIYGIFAISEALGVSPSHWWDDVPVVPHAFDLSERTHRIEPPAVRLRGVFINDEDWCLAPWCRRTLAKAGPKSIGRAFHERFFEMMQRLRLNWFWPAMHEGGFEFVTDREMVDLADAHAIVLGSSHCEAMMRNNVYLAPEDRPKWNFAQCRGFLVDYWRYAVDRYADREIVWTIGMRGIHDSHAKKGVSAHEGARMLEDVFAAQMGLLEKVKQPQTLFIPYNEVMTYYNAGARVPDGTTVMWTNDNFGYVRRTGGPLMSARPQGIYWHVSYYGYPHSYVHLLTTSPGFMWYELVARCAANGVTDAWMINVGDGKPAALAMFAASRFAWSPDAYGPDAQARILLEWAKLNFGAQPADRIRRHLDEYFALGTLRRPEFMCIPWVQSLLPPTRQTLLARYAALLAEDEAIEAALPPALRDAWFCAMGYQVRFLAAAGRTFVAGPGADGMWGRERATREIDALTGRYETLSDGKWKAFWFDTVRETYHLRGDVKNPYSSAFSVMQWPWNEIPNRTVGRDCNFRATQGDVPVRAWVTGDAFAQTGIAKDGAGFKTVDGVGPTGRALALLPIADGVGAGAWAEWSVSASQEDDGLVIDVLPDYALYPGATATFAVSVNGAAAQTAEIPFSHANYGSFGSDPMNTARHAMQQDNFARLSFPVSLKAGANAVRIIAVSPGLAVVRLGAAHMR